VGGYVLRRLWQTIPVLFGVSLLAFAVMHVVPGDPVRLIAGPDAPESVVERIRLELGLDRPLHEQYWSFLHRALRGDLGRSLRSRAPVADEILARFPATLELTTASTVIAVLVGVPLGLIAAVRRATWVDYVAMTTSLSTLSMPVFWLAIVAIWLFSLRLGWAKRPTWSRSILPAEIERDQHRLDRHAVDRGPLPLVHVGGDLRARIELHARALVHREDVLDGARRGVRGEVDAGRLRQFL